MFILCKCATGWIRPVVCSALACFFLTEFLKLPDMATGEQYEYLFAPIRHGLYLVGIWLVGYVYVKEHALRLRKAFGLLEDRVSERTQALEGTLAELSRKNEQLARLATEDPLTGLKNRRALSEQLDVAWGHARRLRAPLSMILFDADHFKRINDSKGHAFGDRCLISIATLLQSHARRSTDIVARYGGEEFVLVLLDTDVIGASILANSVREAVANRQFDASDPSFVLTVSVGVATATPGDPRAIDRLFRDADRALYRAKQEGRNRVRVSDSRLGFSSVLTTGMRPDKENIEAADSIGEPDQSPLQRR